MSEQNAVEKTEVAVEAPKPKAEIITSDDGVLRPRNIDEAYRVANAFLKSAMLPTRFKTPEGVLTAMQLALELGLKPLTALRQIAVVNGTPSLFGDLPLSLCYASGKIEHLKEYYIDANGKEICSGNQNLTSEAVGAICVMKRKGDPEPIETFFTLKDAEKAGLLSSPVWKAYPKRMLRYRARSQALKDKFPDALNGISIAEYDFNVAPDENYEDPNPKENKALSLSEKLEGKK